ncbi:MAG: diguanylate cyclase/phosphodiesterase & domain with sensor, partial [Actinotalea sp.]|nr:diguanylate cyclase/phosphodiesterase & domain with sensor [Actinotalea sp.]
AYPVGDLVLLAQLVHLGVRLIAHSVSLRLLAAALLLVLLADGAFQASAYLPVVEENIRLLDTGWLAGSLLWGAAALHPSMRAAGETHVAPDRTFTVGRLVFLSTSVLLLPLTVLAETAVGARVHMTEVALVSAALIGLVLVRMVMMLRRMTEQSDRLAHLADTDFLTGLESRRRFTERLATALHDGPPPATHASAVLLIGLERFTEINDTLGHRTGDELLRAVATRLRAHLDPAAGVARMGGSVFGVLLPAGTDEAAALATAHAARELLLEPLVLSDVSVTIDSGVGVVLLAGAAADGAPAEPLDEGEVLHRADVALSAAREGDGRVAAYASEMENGGSLAPVLMAELRSALESGEVVVHFQPQIEVATGRVLGAEALVRWQHPEHGLLGPMTFVPAAERTGLIRLLTLYVLDRSLAQCAVWQAAGRDLTVSVNLSVRNLLDPGLVADVREALARHRLAPSLLELEITETMAMVDPTRSVEVLGALDALGVTLSIDDYGTGYGSLAYLQRLPVRRLKIDRSFVAGVLDDAASAAIVRSTIELAHHLGLTVVAEGVEDDETLLTLRDMRCYAAQGFGIGRPVASESLVALVDAIHARVPGLVGADELVGVPRLAGAALAPGGR